MLVHLYSYINILHCIIFYSNPKPSVFWMARTSLCRSSFLLLYTGKISWLKQVWDIGSLQRNIQYEPLHDKTQQNDMYTLKRLRSAWASTQFNQPLLSTCKHNTVAPLNTLTPQFLIFHLDYLPIKYLFWTFCSFWFVKKIL